MLLRVQAAREELNVAYDFDYGENSFHSRTALTFETYISQLRDTICVALALVLNKHSSHIAACGCKLNSW